MVKKHKIISVVLAVIILSGGYYAYSKLTGNSGGTQYVFAIVEKGTLVSSVSGSGQVSASNQLDIKASASGNIVYVGVKSGQYVGAGTLLAQIDDRDAQKAVRDAKTSLESAQLSYDQIVGSINGIRGLKEKNQENLNKAYDDGFNVVASAFSGLPDIMTGLSSILTNRDYDQSQWNLDYYVDAVKLYYEDISIVRDETYQNYQAARDAYDQNFSDYKLISRSSDEVKIEAMIDQTYETSKLVSGAVKSAGNLIQVYKDKLTETGHQPKSLADSHLSSLNGFVSKVNGYIQSLNSAENAIQDNKEALINTEFDIRSQEIQLNKAKDSLTDAQSKLADYYIRAPFSGIIAKVNVKVGDSSSGSVIATLITQQKIAGISLNEVDVSKIKLGNKTTLTFDAVSDLNITGEVSEIDSIGTISQGVVTYNVQIAFDTQDDRVKSGMSVSAAIITDTKQDVLLVPNSAVKSQGGAYYVEMPDSTTPVRQPVEIGASNDTMTEITSGLKEGDSIITRTITASTQSQTTAQQSSSFRIPGLR